MSEENAQQPAAESTPRPDPSSPSTSRTAAAGSLPQSRQRFDPREKSPGFAAFLSLAPGLGQVYVGYYARGACIAFGVIALIMAANAVSNDVAPLFGFSAAFVWAFAVIDAGRIAALYNHAVAGAGSIELPRDFTMPSMGGSIVGGTLLLLLGLIALSHTALGYRLDWLETWWPLLPMGIGAYLLVRGVQDRTT